MNDNKFSKIAYAIYGLVAGSVIGISIALFSASIVYGQEIKFTKMKIYNCYIYDSQLRYSTQNATSKMCMSDLPLRSVGVGNVGSKVTCEVQSVESKKMYRFVVENDEPGKGRVNCIIMMDNLFKSLEDDNRET